MKQKTPLQLKQAKLKELRKEMKEAGIRRSSFMNGGHSPMSYRMNAECFRLETEIQKLKSSTTN